MTQPDPLSPVFGALADPTRRAFVARLGEGEASVSELAAMTAISLPAVSRHVRVLAEAGLVRREKRGRTTWCSLVEHALDDASEWMEARRAGWSGRLDRLTELLEEDP